MQWRNALKGSMVKISITYLLSRLQRLKSEYLKEINRNKAINRAILSKSSFHSEKHSISRSESSDNDGESPPQIAQKYRT